MAYVYFDSKYAPCAFLIVPDGGDPYDDASTTLVQSDWDHPVVASTMGWVPCAHCNATDGTVNCPHRTTIEMIEEAHDYIRKREGEPFPSLDAYLPQERT